MTVSCFPWALAYSITGFLSVRRADRHSFNLFTAHVSIFVSYVYVYVYYIYVHVAMN